YHQILNNKIELNITNSNCTVYLNEFIKNCQQQCKRDCYKQHYEPELKELKESKSKTCGLYLFRYFNRGEHFYHSALMTFEDYICSIGGLLSLWFGMTVLGTLINLVNYIEYFYSNFINLNILLKSIHSKFFLKMAIYLIIIYPISQQIYA